MHPEGEQSGDCERRHDNQDQTSLPHDLNLATGVQALFNAQVKNR
ncbi:MAG: hypothetical protein QOE13_2348 [Gaiellaceae bacterium]|jgi:hypothetical protein|nr:hypothetical protein [Gaiellaceae bacterium]